MSDNQYCSTCFKTGAELDVALQKALKCDENAKRAEEAAKRIQKEFKYTDCNMPILSLTGDVSAMTKDKAVDLRYVYGERSGTASVKWQGSSSLSYPKKNYTIKFDNAFEAVEGWGAQKKYCLKANFIDHSHARNVVSAKLWGQIVKARDIANDKLNALPNGGAIDGFPCIVDLNGEFHGLYTWNIPKDGWMFGMGGGDTEVSDTLKPDRASPATNITTFTYTSIAGYEDAYIRKPGTVSGGRLYIDFDKNKMKRFGVRVFLFDADGNPYKWIGGYDHNTAYCFPHDSVVGLVGNDPVIAGGDYNADEINWSNPGAGTATFRVDAPISIGIPAGYTPMVQFSGLNAATYPDGTVTPNWSQQSDTDGTWSHKWQEKGITATVVGTVAAREAIVCANNHSLATGFWGEALLDESDFELEYVSDEDNADWVLPSLNTLIRSCLNSDGSDLDTTVAKYLDWQSAIDYYIFVSLLRGGDMMDKNYLLATYDGTKWFFSAYDIDSTYGLGWDGRSIGSSTGFSFMTFAGANKVMDLIRKYKTSELKARYAEIRDAIMSEDNVAVEFLNFVGLIPTVIFNEDVRKWPTIPSTASSNVAQILNWYRMRVAVIDKEMEDL